MLFDAKFFIFSPNNQKIWKKYIFICRMFGVSAGLRIKDVDVAIPENFRKLKQKQKAFSLDDGLRYE